MTKKELAPTIKLFEVFAPLVAKKAKPGQFIILRIDEKGERIPLTIADFDAQKGTITIIFQEVGKTTKLLGLLNEGDCISDFMGPLGNPTKIEKYGRVVCVGGGVGVASIPLKAKALGEAGNEIISIIGARTKELLILEEELQKISDELYITTDDGSKGHHGFVTDILKKLIDERKNIDLVVTVGPVIMMKAVANVTRPHNIRTIASLNPIMVDGTGMCGSCRVRVDGRTQFTCVDGPEFDAHRVDFDHLMTRLQRYLTEEKLSLDGAGLG
ncbi:MAG: sulfide/dihydroorotate dehydrogenase-like FAD/NAD-binding protein [Methanocellales archaeon]|nr:sulfide/dihydroorotate dehydrogenase-like FAD/NAD-binding protein [Methanocellales archaeon]MDD3420865.1 sulfide/dihydroorotate dehydrogenase-like FAD/NAD-binding protein [Methanocellales archaeon]MDD5446874.1 sulfide/dihydroorotate dehydrogenase-like FAD/NAD-binding protein [Methanocellales archaeon]